MLALALGLLVHCSVGARPGAGTAGAAHKYGLGCRRLPQGLDDLLCFAVHCVCQVSAQRP